MFLLIYTVTKYDKQDQQGKAAFNERNPQRWRLNMQAILSFYVLQFVIEMLYMFCMDETLIRTILYAFMCGKSCFRQ
jgi:hypothetical protein